MTAGGRQTSLLGFEEPPPRKSAVQPCVPSAQVRATGEALPADIRLGTSTWSFPGWQGLVYDAVHTSAEIARNGLTAYSAHPLLGAVGLDRTYYGPLTPDQAARMAGQVPDGFRFMVKAPRDLCNDWSIPVRDRRLCDPFDASWANHEVIHPLIEGMGDKLGALVFQFAPHPRGAFSGPDGFASALGGFLARLTPGPMYAVEIRNREWLTPAYVAALSQHGATHCLSVHPKLPTLHEQMRLVGPALQGGVVLRWNLGHGLAYEAAYDRYHPFNRIVDPDLVNRDHIARLCARAHLAGKPSLVSVNNKAEGSAPASIVCLAEAIVERLQDALE